MQIAFTGVLGQSFEGDISLDDIRLSAGCCQCKTVLPCPQSILHTVPLLVVAWVVHGHDVAAHADRSIHIHQAIGNGVEAVHSETLALHVPHDTCLFCTVFTACSTSRLLYLLCCTNFRPIPHRHTRCTRQGLELGRSGQTRPRHSHRSSDLCRLDESDVG